MARQEIEYDYIADGAPTGYVMAEILEQLGVKPTGQMVRLRIEVVEEIEQEGSEPDDGPMPGGPY